VSSLSEEKVLLELSYTLEFDDMKNAYFNRLFSNKRFIGSIVFSVLLFLTISFLLVFGILNDHIGALEILPFGLAFAFVIFYPLVPLLNYTNMRKIWITSQHLPLNFYWKFFESNVTIVGVFRHSIYRWQYFYQIIEFKDDIGFYLNSREYQYLPKRVLTEEQLVFIRELIKQRMNPVMVKLKNS